METFGQVMRGLRGELSLRELARQIFLDPGHLSRIETGHRHPTETVAASLDAALEAGGKLVALAAARRQAKILPVAGSGRNGPRGRGEMGRPRDDLATIRSFRIVDSRIGGGYLYLTVAGYLQHTIAPRLVGGEADHHGPDDMLAAAAAMTEMVGWMAHDGGRDDLAGRHLHAALGMARGAGDGQLAAHILGSLSHVAHSTHRPGEAIMFAARGRDISAELHPGVAARLLALRARGYAAHRDSERCHSYLDQAERALATAESRTQPVWVSDFDQASLAIEAGRCFYQLGDLREARHQAELVLELRPRERARSRAFAQLLLAHVLLACGEVDQACAVGDDVLDATRTVGSRLVTRQLEWLERRLATHRGVPAVATFRHRLREELLGRAWLDQWPPQATSSHDGQAAS